MQENKRIDYMDIAKGVAVLLVIFGHTFRESMRADAAWCDIAYLFVYRFHVALLFMLSGMGYALTKARNASLTTGAYLKKKAKTLLLPWVTYSVLIYVVFAAVQLVPPVRAMLASSAYAFVSPPPFWRTNGWARVPGWSNGWRSRWCPLFICWCAKAGYGCLRRFSKSCCFSWSAHC